MVSKKYEIFVKVAESKNLTKVANELSYTQSAISHSIQSLEKELELPLIQRTKNGISLTPYGEALLPDFRKILLDEEILLQKSAQYRGLKKGTLRVGAFTSASVHWIPSVAQKIAADYPNIKLTQSHGSYDGIITKLENGDVDIGFLTETTKGAFEFMPLIRDEYFVLLPPTHPLVKYERIPIEALDNERLVLMDEGGHFDSWHIVNQICNPDIVHYVHEDFLVLPLVEHGIGISILPGLIADYFETYAVKKRFARPRYRTIGLAAKSFKDAPPLVNLFIELLNNYLDTWEKDTSNSYKDVRK